MTRLAIVGGGPAGLSLARLLTERGHKDITVFEALGEVGGKSFTVVRGQTLVEMGTCYATYSHRVVLRWMRELAIPLKRLGQQVFDDGDFIAYVHAGSGAPVSVQAIRFLMARRSLLNRLRRLPPSRDALLEAALPVSEWLKQRRLGKIERLMERALSSIAYGFLDEVATIHALRWVDPELIASGLTNQLRMPVEGWAPFWARLAGTLDVRLSTPVTRIERRPGGVRIETPEGAEAFDAVVCAIPFDDFTRLTDTMTPDEEFVRAGVTYGGYTTTIAAVEDWFTGHHVEAYSEPIRQAAQKGRLLSARLEGHEPELGGHLYLTGQYSGDYTPAELRDILVSDITARGGRVTNIILQKLWKYMAFYKAEAIEAGLLARLERMQGEMRTFYSGAAWSHEAVSHIVNYNRARLVPCILGWSPQAA